MNTAFVHIVGLFFYFFSFFVGCVGSKCILALQVVYLFFLSIDGYAFSQEEHGVVSQSQVVRSYDTTRQRPSI